MNTRRTLGAVLAVVWIGLPGGSRAATLIEGPVRFIVPFPAGTSADFIARLLAQPVGDSLGSQVVVDNRGGASGTIGVAIGAQAPGNGRTWIMGTTTTHAIAPHFGAKPAYHPAKDFAPVALLGEAAYLLTGYPGIAAANVSELVALARAHPRKFSYASVGNFSLAHLSMESLAKAAGIVLTHVPYKGSSLAVVDLVAGRVQLNFSTMPAILPHVQAGRLRAFAAASRARLPMLPALPTLAESGFAGFSASLWLGVFVPSATPPAIVTRLNREFDRALASGGVRAQLADNGFEPRGGGPRVLADLMTEEAARWGRVIRDTGIGGT